MLLNGAVLSGMVSKGMELFGLEGLKSSVVLNGIVGSYGNPNMVLSGLEQ